MQLINTLFCIELRERSVLENEPQIFYVTVSFDIALYTPTSWMLAWELHRKDKKKEKYVTFQQELPGVLQS